MSQRRYALACRGEPCYLQIPGAPSHDRRTVVPCHSNQQAHGKGMPDVLRRVREMAKSKDQRIADTAPKAMRQRMREDVARVRADL